MISEVDENMSGSIDFAEFLKVIENQKERADNFDDENQPGYDARDPSYQGEPSTDWAGSGGQQACSCHF